MDNLARTIEQGAVTHEAGHVVAVTRTGYRVRTRSGMYDARRATSCLVAAEEGDLVELVLVEGADCFVLAVLQADPERTTRLVVEGDLDLAPQGRLRMASPEGIDLVSDDEVSVLAARVSVRAVDARATFERFTAIGKFLNQQIERVRSVSSTVDSVADRITQTVERCTRFVGESDTLRAGRIDHEAKETMRLHAGNAVVTADKLVKVDGGQIHMG